MRKSRRLRNRVRARATASLESDRGGTAAVFRRLRLSHLVSVATPHTVTRSMEPRDPTRPRPSGRVATTPCRIGAGPRRQGLRKIKANRRIVAIVGRRRAPRVRVEDVAYGLRRGQQRRSVPAARSPPEPGEREARNRRRSEQRSLLDAVYATGSMIVAAEDRALKLTASRLQVYGFVAIEEVARTASCAASPVRGDSRPRRTALAPVEAGLRRGGDHPEPGRLPVRMAGQPA